MAAFKKTKTLIFSIFLLLATTAATHAADSIFSWTANAETVSGYKIHYGTSSRSYNFEVDVPQPAAVNGRIIATVSGLQDGQTYYFAATAYVVTADSIIKESEYSNEVVYTVPGTGIPQPPVADDSAGTSDPATGTIDLNSVNDPSAAENSGSSPENATSDFAFELGELVVTSDWQHVAFSTEYTSPAVIAKSTTMNDPEAGVVSIRNLTSRGFDIRIREWDNADGVHPEEIVSFMVMERGHHQVADNVYADAECTSLSGLNTFQSIHFANSFSSQPVVVSSIVTEHEANAATLRMKEVTLQGFSITMQEQENNDGSHTEETVCYIAMEKWSGVVDGLMVEAGTTEKNVTDQASTISFKQQFPTIPFVLADMQTANDMDTAIVGMSELSVTSAGLKVLEEQSAGSEVSHTGEVGGYFAVTPYNPQEDSDLDGLSNEEELAIHTHPGLWDTDQDAINDGNEYNYWLTSGINPEIDSDGDGISNLQDNDSDNDGFPDGVEILRGFNPTDIQSLPSFTFETGELTVGTAPVWINFKNSYIEPAVIN